jgi:hypothetical protein
MTAEKKLNLIKSITEYNGEPENILSLIEDIVNPLKEKKFEETYEEVVKKVSPRYYMNECGEITKFHFIPESDCETQVPSKNHALQLKAIIEMMNIAEYVNEGWKPNILDSEIKVYSLEFNRDTKILEAVSCYNLLEAVIIFKSKEAAQKAIEIAGEQRLKHYFGIFE